MSSVSSVLSSSILATSLATSLLVGCTDSEPKIEPYRVVSTVELPSDAIPARQLEEISSPIRDFGAAPGPALIDYAELGGVVAARTLRSELPLSLASRLEGWMSLEIAKAQVNGKPLADYLGAMKMIGAAALAKLSVESQLDDVARTHQITGLDLAAAGLEVRVPFESIAGDNLMQQPEITIAADGALSLGEQRFGLAYGAHAWDGIDAASTAMYGDTVRATLGAAINCPAFASAISKQCLLDVCVGHEADVLAVCEGGLDQLVSTTREKFGTIVIEELHFSKGDARLVDGDGDGVNDRIEDGVWQAELNLGLGLRTVTAKFAGARE
jgi:hypothetical protein